MIHSRDPTCICHWNLKASYLPSSWSWGSLGFDLGPARGNTREESAKWEQRVLAGVSWHDELQVHSRTLHVQLGRGRASCGARLTKQARSESAAHQSPHCATWAAILGSGLAATVSKFSVPSRTRAANGLTVVVRNCACQGRQCNLKGAVGRLHAQSAW